MLSEIIQFLGSRTPQSWVEAARQNTEILLLDHKNCEYKAASNAITLMAKYQESEGLVLAMARLAREELAHFEQVQKLIKRRAIALRPVSASRYAMGLRSLVRRTEPGARTDLLLIGAFIEARSCERFSAVATCLDDELCKFYQSLLKSEIRHYQGYIRLAQQYGDSEDIARRVEVIRIAEQALIADPDPEFRFHSGAPI